MSNDRIEEKDLADRHSRMVQESWTGSGIQQLALSTHVLAGTDNVDGAPEHHDPSWKSHAVEEGDPPGERGWRRAWRRIVGR